MSKKCLSYLFLFGFFNLKSKFGVYDIENLKGCKFIWLWSYLKKGIE